MMNADERNGFLSLLQETQQAIEDGEQKTRETKERLDILGQKLDQANASLIPYVRQLLPVITPIKVAGRWHRSSPLQFLKTPLGTNSSRLHPARYNRRQETGGAIYIASKATTTAAERKQAALEEAFYSFPVDISLQRVLDLSTKRACDEAGVSHDLIRVEWQFIHDIVGKVPYTHLIGELALEHLFEGILFESVRLPGTHNLVIFPAVMQIGSYVKVHDEKGLFVKAHGCKEEDLSIVGIVPTAEP